MNQRPETLHLPTKREGFGEIMSTAPSAEMRLKELEIELPDPPKPLGAYVRAVQSGALLFLSGMLPVRDEQPLITGIIGSGLTINDGQNAVRQATLNGLAAVRAQLGSLDHVRRIVRISVFQRAAPEFTGHAKVADAASQLLRDVFGSAGDHARMVFGVSSLPAGMPVEVEFVLEVRMAADVEQSISPVRERVAGRFVASGY
jgi:enamine deaminase RidA (YjgF/YER057c/UK114 family)